MLPPGIASSYGNYKRDNNAIATWLANTATKLGPIKDSSGPTNETFAQGDVEKSPKTKSKSKKKKRNSKKSSIDSSVSESLSIPAAPSKHYIGISSFVVLAETIREEGSTTVPDTFSKALDRALAVRRRVYQRELEGGPPDPNDTANHFYVGQSLHQVREILRPLMHAELADDHNGRLSSNLSNRVQSTSTTAHVVGSLPTGPHVSNPSEASSQVYREAAGAVNAERSDQEEAVWKATGLHTAGEQLVASYLMIGDVAEIRTLLIDTWFAYQSNRVDLTSAAVTTDLATGLVRSIEKEFFEDFPGAIDFGTVVEGLKTIMGMESGLDVVNGPKSQFNPLVFDKGENLLYSTYMVLKSFIDLDGPVHEYIPRLRDLDCAYEPSTDRARKSGREKFEEDRALIAGILPDVWLMAEATSGDEPPFMDELTRGVAVMISERKIPLWLVFAAQALLDAHHVLREQAHRPFQELLRDAEGMRASLKETLDFQNDITRNPHWPLQNDVNMVSLLVQIEEWVINDPVSLALQVKGSPPPYHSHKLFKRYPIFCGLLMFHIRLRFHEIGIHFANAWGAVTSCAQLYNAIRQEGYFRPCRWRDMDILTLLHDISELYGGEQATNRVEYLQHFLITMGDARKLFATSEHSEDAINSGTTSRGLKKLAPVSRVLEDRYCTEKRRADPRGWEVNKILKHYLMDHEDYGPVTKSTTRGLTRGSATADSSEKCPKQEGPRPSVSKSSARVTLSELLRILRDSLHVEAAALVFDHLHMHWSCWYFLRKIVEVANDAFKRAFGPRCIEQERHLPFLVGYIFVQATSADTIARDLPFLPQRDSEVSDELLGEAAMVLDYIIEIGKGAHQAGILHTYGFDYDEVYDEDEQTLTGDEESEVEDKGLRVIVEEVEAEEEAEAAEAEEMERHVDETASEVVDLEKRQEQIEKEKKEREKGEEENEKATEEKEKEEEGDSAENDVQQRSAESCFAFI